MRASHLKVAALSAAATLVCSGLVLFVGNNSRAYAHSGITLSGVGSALIDGVLSPGEWVNAARHDFAVKKPEADGGGTAPATLLVMNDAANLYLAVQVWLPALDHSSVTFEFDDNNDGTCNNGEDALVLNSVSGLYDDFRTGQGGSDVCTYGPTDADAGGATNGSGAVRNNGAFSFYEISHPLNSGDTGHDFALAPGSSVGVRFAEFRICKAAACTDTPFFLHGDILVAIPPGPALLTPTGPIMVAPEQFVPLPISLGAAAPPNGVLITLTSSDTSVVTVTPTVAIPGGASTPDRRGPVLTGVKFGQATILIGAPGYAGSTVPVMVTTTMTFWPPSVTLAGTSTQARPVLTLSAPAPSGGVAIALSSDNPNVAAVPAGISIPAGALSIAVPITPVGTGATTIRARVSPLLPESTLGVTVIP